MTGVDLLSGRETRGWSQAQAAIKLGVSQPYLSLLEKGSRRIPEKLAQKASSLYQMSAAKLPIRSSEHEIPLRRDDELVSDLSALGYPGFSQVRSHRKRNPAEVMLSALRVSNLDSRITEALPWLILRHPDLDWLWLIRGAKIYDLQNKLGFIISLARRVAQKLKKPELVLLLREQEMILDRSRLVLEQTLCHDSITQPERRWLRANRSKEAKHWNLLTDLTPEQLDHGAEVNS